MKLKYFATLALIACLAQATEIDSQIATINGHQLHYYKIGTSGSPLILLTGYATTSNFWNTRFVECLAQQHQVYLFDYAGINTPYQQIESRSIQTMASDVNQLSIQLGLSNPSLIGWSMGGGVALQASFDAQERYTHLYLLAPIVPFQNGSFSSAGKTHQPFKTSNNVLNYVFNNNLSNYNQASLSTLQAQLIQPQVTDLFPAKNIIIQQEQAISSWISNPTSTQSFQHTQVPATFYIPDQDQIIQQNYLKGVIASYPNSTVVRVSGSGHAVAWQYPIEICNNITADMQSN